MDTIPFGGIGGNNRAGEENGDLDVSRIYTPLSVAKEEIWKRWNNENLKKEVEKFLGNDIPEVFKRGPRAVLGRCLTTPNRESVHFLGISQKLHLEPLFVEYLDDKFVAANTDKYYLGKLFLYDGKGRHGGDKVDPIKIVTEIDGSDGVFIRGMRTLWGEGFPEFHHRMFRESMPKEYAESIFDISEWFSRHGGKAKEYYPRYLALFMCHSVLVEVFLMYNRKEGKFFDEVVVPAVDSLEKTFGVKPIMTPLFSGSGDSMMSDDEKHWMYYPESMRKMIPEMFAK